MRLEQVDVPQPGPGDALVQVAAAGVNFIDVYYRSGVSKAPSLPLTIGSEAAGMVVSVGAGVSEVAPGDRVAYAMVFGAYAEYAVVPAWRLVKVPDAMELETAAAIMLQGMTAHYLTHSTYPLRQGHTALVHAAAGGAGLLLTQAAVRRGARVIGTVGSDAKATLARDAGASDVIVYSRVDFDTEARRLTGGRGVDVVYDSVGAATFDRSLNALRPRGMLVLFGNSSGQVPPFDPYILGAKGSLFLTRPGLLAHLATRDEILERAGAVFDWVMKGEMRVRIDRVLPLEDAGRAHELLESRQTTGKMLLRPT